MGEPLTEVDKARIEVDFAALVNMTPAEMRDWGKSPFAGQNRLAGAAQTQAKESLIRAGRLADIPVEKWGEPDYVLAAEAVESIELALQGKAKDPLVIDGSEGPAERDAVLRDAGHDTSRADSRADGSFRQDARPGWVWRTQKDSRVRESHAALNGKRFDVHARHDSEGLPGDAFGCRCYPEILPQRGTKREADAIGRQTRNASARAMTRWTPERKDFKADSIMVALPVPAELAAQVGMPDPHVTMVYVGPGTEEHAVAIALIVADELGTRWSLIGREPSDQIELFVRGAKASLVGLGYFENEERVAFARVSVPADVAALRDRIAARICAIGIDIPNPTRGWVPHLTLAFLEPGQAFGGPVPAGDWPIEAVEVWRGPGTRLIVRTNGDVDRIELAGGRWTAYRKAGDKDIGSFGSEAEARAALIAADNQRALAGRYDAGPPAVHTETRNFIEETRSDRLSLGPVVESNDDWCEYQVLYSRAEIVQPYRFDGKLYHEYRARADVFEPASLKSGRGIPWEVKHSASLLTQDTVLGVAAGCTLTVEEHQDGLHTTGLAKAWDRNLRAHAKAGGDVSVAYRLKIDPRPGTTDSGQRFDRRQYHIRWNSLAAELAGNAGTARVLPVRTDAKSCVVTSADAMLAAAREARADSAPIFFDLSEWTRRADAVPPASQPVPDQAQDTQMNSPLQILIAAAGVSPADLSAALGIAEPDLAKLIAGEVDLTPEQATKLLSALAPVRDDAPPPPPTADMVVVKIGDKETKVPADAAAEITMLVEKASVAGDRADRAEHRADRTEVEKRTLAAQLKAIQDSQGSMVSRADADQMVREQALVCAEVIDLARRANGATWSPEARKDSAGAEQSVDLADWQRGAIRGAYGDKADKILARIDAAPVANQAALLQIRLDDAREMIDAQANKSGSIRKVINESRDNEAQRRQDEATRGDKDDLAETQTQQQDHGANYVGATKKTA